jgi:hypothetical protein
VFRSLGAIQVRNDSHLTLEIRATWVNPLVLLARALSARAVRFLVIGVAGANPYAVGGADAFVTEDSRPVPAVRTGEPVALLVGVRRGWP